jgi:hypothetical protein
MHSACTHQTLAAPTVSHAGALSNAHALLGPLAAFVARFWRHELPADRAYARLLEGSAGKLTDSLEREAELSLRRGSGLYG